MTIARFQTGPGAIRIIASLQDRTARLRPHVEIGDADVRARHRRGTQHLDDTTVVRAVGGGSVPPIEADVGILDAVACDCFHARPGTVEIEAISVRVAHKIIELDVCHCPVTAVGLEHEHLVGVMGIDVSVLNVMNVCTTISLFM